MSEVIAQDKEIEMLESIHVKNVALIDEAQIQFQDGLNILTGETGAGKSILLSSVQLALGAKADKSLIRQGAEYAFAELVFSLDEEKKKLLADYELDTEDDVLILQRKIYPNKSSCKINGETVTVKTMQSIAEHFIDIHGQREHQVILNASRQETILDDYGKTKLAEDLKEITLLYKQCRELEAELEEADSTDASQKKDLDFARFEYDEIEKANLKEGEDFLLEEKYQKLTNAQKIMEAVGSAEAVLQNDSGSSVLNMLSVAIRHLLEAQTLDGTLTDKVQQLSDAETLLQECSQGLDRYLDSFHLETDDFSGVEERLNLINHLKDKYGREITDILAYANELNSKISRLENFEQYYEGLKQKLEAAKKRYFALAKKIHEERMHQAESLSQEMEQALKDLNFEQCTFAIDVSFDAEQMTKTGCNKVVFRISLNPGEPLKDLSAVASGGELSRIMLALKTIFADKDKTATLVFDEIDAGISGKTAWKVAEKLAVLRNRHQVICITHLPQIAAMADAHYGITKRVEETGTKTSVKALNEDESIQEVGRLLGTDQLTDAVLKNAKEMKDLAEETKQSQIKNK